jgi:copper chaperone NosL
MKADSRPLRWLRSLLVASVAVGALTLALRWAQNPPDGPIDPTWSRTACARCGMLVGERAFAAQAHSASGEVRFFDDAGCLLLYGAEHPAEKSAWFHHLREERWIPASLAGFVSAEATPMGYGFAAVDAGEPGAISRAEALAEVQRRESSRRGSRP